MPRIVADTDILAVREAFKRLGSLECIPGREINRSHLGTADALIVRSITQVNARLLEGTPVRWVGTATSGLDHVDLDFLADRGITLCHAPGANARAVVEYVIAALASLQGRHKIEPGARSFGLVGAGNVGGRLAILLRQLGFEVTVSDPAIAPGRRKMLEKKGVRFVSLDELLHADVVSLHVPLSLSGPHATFRMLNADRLSQLSRGAVLINTSRGAVIDSLALSDTLARRPDLAAVLDVWEGEPEPDPVLLARTTIASPHIAGHSLDAKLKATLMLYAGFQSFCSSDSARERALIEKGYLTPVTFDPVSLSEDDSLCNAVLGVALDLVRIDGDLRAAAREERLSASLFDSVRRGLRNRREFSACRVNCSGATNQQRDLLAALGFQLTPR